MTPSRAEARGTGGRRETPRGLPSRLRRSRIADSSRSIVRPTLRYDGRVSDRILVRVTPEPLSTEDALAFVADPGAGASCLFVGTVRESSDAGEVTGLRYEAWDELAQARLREIAGELFESWPLLRVAIVHRTGDLAVG